MKSYREYRDLIPDFRVSYRFLNSSEGGRSAPPWQHTRWDYLYVGADLQELSMIWPEFIDSTGVMLPEGEVPMSGLADMFIVNWERRDFHLSRMAVGTKGYFMEGPHVVAECETIEILGLPINPRKGGPGAIDLS